MRIRLILIATLVAWLAALPAQAEQIVCPDARAPWTLDERAAPAGTVVLRDGAARAVCTYRHPTAEATASATFVWVARGAGAAAPDPLLRCDPAVFARQHPGSHFNAELGAYVHPSFHTLGYVAIGPAPPVDRDDAVRWDTMRWRAQLAYATEIEDRAAPCWRTPGRDVTLRPIADPGIARVDTRQDGARLAVSSHAELPALFTLAREPVRSFRAAAVVRVPGTAGGRTAHRGGLVLARDAAATIFADGDLHVGVSHRGTEIVIERREGGGWRTLAERPLAAGSAIRIAIERPGDAYVVAVDGSELGRVRTAAGAVWVRFAVDAGAQAVLQDWQVEAVP